MQIVQAVNETVNAALPRVIGSKAIRRNATEVEDGDERVEVDRLPAHRPAS
jgi:hypothetical protein